MPFAAELGRDHARRVGGCQLLDRLGADRVEIALARATIGMPPPERARVKSRTCEIIRVMRDALRPDPRDGPQLLWLGERLASSTWVAMFTAFRRVAQIVAEHRR